MDARAAIGKASAVFPVAFVALEAAITAVWVTSDGRRKNEMAEMADSSHISGSSSALNCR